MATKTIADHVFEIIDENSGGIKGLDLMAKLVERVGLEAANANILTDAQDIVEGNREFGVLRYGMKLDEDLLREKFFFFRRINPGSDTEV
jgi:hypothetical protein